MNFTARIAHFDDLDTLVSFALHEAEDAEGITLTFDIVRVGIQDALENPDIARYWTLVDSDGNVVGNISVLKEWSNWKAGFYWWIQSVYIRPEHRGRNGLKALMDKVKETAIGENALEIRLYVHQDNHRARRAYQRSGFTEAPYVIMAMDLSSG